MTRITPRPASSRSRLAAAAENAQRRWDSHCIMCGRCYRSSYGWMGQECAEGRDLRRDVIQARRRAA